MSPPVQVSLEAILKIPVSVWPYTEDTTVESPGTAMVISDDPKRENYFLFWDKVSLCSSGVLELTL